MATDVREHSRRFLRYGRQVGREFDIYFNQDLSMLMRSLPESFENSQCVMNCRTTNCHLLIRFELRSEKNSIRVN